MSKLVRCDFCGSDRKATHNMWLTLNWEGKDLRHRGSPEQQMPLDFCSIHCVAKWIEDKVKEMDKWKAQVRL